MKVAIRGLRDIIFIEISDTLRSTYINNGAINIYGIDNVRTQTICRSQFDNAIFIIIKCYLIKSFISSYPQFIVRYKNIPANITGQPILLVQMHYYLIIFQTDHSLSVCGDPINIIICFSDCRYPGAKEVICFTHQYTLTLRVNLTEASEHS